MPRPPVALAWIRAAIEAPSDDCMPWPFVCDSRGYGIVKYQGRARFAHRVAVMLATGKPDEPTWETRHLCGVTSCVNPRHLVAGTRAENEADKRLHGTAPIGERHHAAALTEQDVRAIRASSDGPTALAARYGISRSAVKHVRARRTWQHVV